MAGLTFASNYDLAEFIIRFLLLPVIIGCGIASCVLRTWKGANRSSLITYNIAVITTLISMVFYIAHEGHYAAASDLSYYSLRNSNTSRTNIFRQLAVLGVFVVALDLISKIAIIAAVIQSALASTISSGSRTFLHIFRIAVVAVLALLLILAIAFNGHYVHLGLNPRSAYSVYDTYKWLERFYAVEVTFYTIYLLSAIAVLVTSILSRSPPALAASVLLLALSILVLASSAGFMDFVRSYLASRLLYPGKDYNTFGSFASVAAILVAILQTGVLVALLLGGESREDGRQTTRTKKEVTNA